MVQLNDPSLGVLATAVPTEAPALSSSILTFAPGLPVEVHVIVCVVPCAQLSPPLGLVTVMVDVVPPPVPIVK